MKKIRMEFHQAFAEATEIFQIDPARLLQNRAKTVKSIIERKAGRKC